MILKATSYNANGDAIALKDNKVFYVRGLIKGEEAECTIIEEHEKWGKAEIKKILTPSPNRNINIPKNHLKIGGYELLHMNREEQTYFKNEKIKDDFKRNAQYDIQLDELFVGQKLIKYRNKITLHDGGFHERNTNKIIKINPFLLTNIPIKDYGNGEVIVRQLDTLIYGKKGEKNIYTTDKININNNILSFRINLNAFYQVNKEIAEKVYEKMLSFLPEDSIVFDLFSGIGTITLLAALKAKKVIGVERNKYSHNDAIYNKKINKIKNVEFVNDNVFNYVKSTQLKPDIVIVDPAREGLKKKTCEMLLKLKPKKIIYLSCNPGTQASDFNILKSHYNLVYAKPYDMFPQTHHIENLIVLDIKEEQ